MNYYKRFADFCGGVGAVSALLFAFFQFMDFSPKDEVSLLEKVNMFFDGQTLQDDFVYIYLAVLLTISLILSCLVKKRPHLSFFVSLPPLLYCMFLFSTDRLYDRPMLYLLLCLLFLSGGFFECIQRDREEGGFRSALAADLTALTTALLCISVFFLAKALPNIPLIEMNVWERVAHAGLSGGASPFPYLTLALIYCGTAAIRLLWKDLYFADALLSLLAGGYTVYLLKGGAIPCYGAVLATAATVYTVVRIVIMLSCPTSIRTKK